VLRWNVNAVLYELGPRQAEPRQAEPRQAEPRQAEPRQAESCRKCVWRMPILPI